MPSTLLRALFLEAGGFTGSCWNCGHLQPLGCPNSPFFRIKIIFLKRKLPIYPYLNFSGCHSSSAKRFGILILSCIMSSFLPSFVSPTHVINLPFFFLQIFWKTYWPVICQMQASLCAFIIHNSSLNHFTTSSNSHLSSWSADGEKPEYYVLFGGNTFLFFFLSSFTQSTFFTQCLFFFFIPSHTHTGYPGPLFHEFILVRMKEPPLCFFGSHLSSAWVQGWLSLLWLQEALCLVP